MRDRQMRDRSSRGRKSCMQILAILALCSVAWVGVVEAQGITPGKWEGGNPTTETPFYMCLHVSDDGQRLTAVGTQCTGNQGQDRNSIDIQWQSGTTPDGETCNQNSYRGESQGDVQIGSDGTFVHTFNNAFVSTTVTGKFDPTQRIVSGTARTINPFIDCQIEWTAAPTQTETVRNQRESVEAFVARFYRLILVREPDPSAQGWGDNLLSGQSTGCDIAFGFIFSPEFINRNTTDEQYVEVLYQAFFNRPADPAGKSGWLNALQSGSLREDVLNGFLFSQEFAALAASFGITACAGGSI